MTFSRASESPYACARERAWLCWFSGSCALRVSSRGFVGLSLCGVSLGSGRQNFSRGSFDALPRRIARNRFAADSYRAQARCVRFVRSFSGYRRLESVLVCSIRPQRLPSVVPPSMLRFVSAAARSPCSARSAAIPQRPALLSTVESPFESILSSAHLP